MRVSHCEEIEGGIIGAGEEIARVLEGKGKGDCKEVGVAEKIGGGGGREVEEKGTKGCRV